MDIFSNLNGFNEKAWQNINDAVEFNGDYLNDGDYTAGTDGDETSCMNFIPFESDIVDLYVPDDVVGESLKQVG